MKKLLLMLVLLIDMVSCSEDYVVRTYSHDPYYYRVVPYYYNYHYHYREYYPRYSIKPRPHRPVAPLPRIHNHGNKPSPNKGGRR